MIAILLDLFWRDPGFVQPDMANGICVRGLCITARFFGGARI